MQSLKVLCLVLLVQLAVGTTHDNSPCTVLNLASSYDAIVVGSGPGGSVAARRLAEATKSSGHGHFVPLQVLQVERGALYSECPECAIPSEQTVALGDPTSGKNILTTPQTSIINSPTVSVKDAAVQGGASSVNGLLHIRPDGLHYFNTFWPSNWRWGDLLPYFIRYENYNFSPGFYGSQPFNYLSHLRGDDGPVKVTQSDATGFAHQFIDVVRSVFPNVPAFYNNSLNNGFFPGVGVAPPEHTYFNGVRSSSFSSYIQTYTASNLRSIAHVRVNKVIFSGTQVTGVELVFVNITTKLANSSTCVVSTNTVISSAGAFGTPKLLKLSGVGPSAELTAHGIHVVVDNAHVGANLADHFAVAVSAVSGFTTLPPIPDLYGQLFWNVLDSVLLPPDFSINVPVINIGIELAIFTATRVYAESRGTVTLASNNPDVDPIVNPNYLSTFTDQLVTAIAINKTVQIVNQLGLFLTSNPCASADCSTPQKLLNAWLAEESVITPGYHYSGTAALDKVTDSTTLRVKGTTGLYVLDASIFPLTPGENTQSTTYAVAERGIEFIIQDHPTWTA